MTALEAALDYIRRGWHVIPTRNKVPLTPHGLKDGTTYLETIAGWWRIWPDAVPAIVTGAISSLIVLDIDIDARKGVNGLDALDALGIATHPTTPTAHTPRGGLHLLFAHPGHDVKNSAGKIGPGIDVRGDGGYIVAPPEPGRFWDPHLGSDTPLAQMPDWMIVRESALPTSAEVRPRPTVRLSRYCETALDSAVKAIVSAPSGAQQETLNREAFSIGRLAGSGAIAPGLALDALTWAARQMPTYDAREPWRPVDLDRIVNRSFSEGLRQPRGVPR
jgi:putative DNA primase/helicase